MVTTKVPDWEGEPTLTPDMVGAFHVLLVGARGDEDKTTDDGLAAYYEGYADAMENVLNVLFGIETHEQQKKEVRWVEPRVILDRYPDMDPGVLP